jgi:hypothetical protein
MTTTTTTTTQLRRIGTGHYQTLDGALVPTTDLEKGDVVESHGMLIRLGAKHTSYRPGVVYFEGEVLNRESFAPGGERQDAFIYNHSAHGWTVQGNALRSWWRVSRRA